REWAVRLGNACEDRGVLIHTPVKSFDLADPGDRMVWTFTAMTNEEEVRKHRTKAKARVARQRERGERLGQKPYGDLPGEDWQHVVEVFKAVGSYQGAARALIAEGFPSRRSHLPNRKGRTGVMQTWSASTVRSIVRYRAPDIIPARTIRRSR